MPQPKVVSSAPSNFPATGLAGGRTSSRPRRFPAWLRRLPGRHLRRGAALFATLLALQGSGRAGTLFLAELSGAKELPPTIATATGRGVIIVNEAAFTSTISASWQGVTGITGGRIHRGAADVEGPAIFPFATTGNPSTPFTWNLSPVALRDLGDGGLYLDLTTAAFPNGVMRGQIFRATLGPAAANGAQSKLASLVLDVSAGFDADLDRILIATNLSPREVQTQALNDLLARTAYVPARQEIEALAGFTAGIFGYNEETRLIPEKKTGFGTFLRSGGQFGRRSAGDNQAGSTISQPLFVGGLDQGFGDSSRAGLAVGYANGRDTFTAGAGRTRTKTTAIQAYGSTRLGDSAVILDAAAGLGWGRVEAVRNLMVPLRTASAAPDGTVWSAALKASRSWTLRHQATLIPYVQFDTQRAVIDGYTETGAGAANLVIPELTTRNSAFEGGVSLALPFRIPSGTLTARVQAGWHYLFENGADTFSTRLAGSPIAFDTRIDGPGRSSAHVEASLTAAVTNRTLATLGYRGELGAGGQTVHALEARFVFRQ